MMQATLMWTINDFPTYGMLSGGELMVNWHAHIAWSIQRHLDYIIGGKLLV